MARIQIVEHLPQALLRYSPIFNPHIFHDLARPIPVPLTKRLSRHCASFFRAFRSAIIGIAWTLTSTATFAQVPPPNHEVESILPGSQWPVYRGDASATGVSSTELPQPLKILWRVEIPNGSFAAPAAIAADRVFIGDMDGTVHALNLTNGEIVWRYTCDSGFLAAPAVRNEAVYIGDLDGTLHAVHARSGELIWKYTADAEIDSGANFFRAGVLFGSQDATLYYLDAAGGTLTWRVTINDQIRCSPTVTGSTGFVAGCDARLHVIDLAEGKFVRSIDLDGPTGVTAACVGDRVYCGTESGTVFAIDWKAGQILWEYRDADKALPIRSSPAVGQGMVVIGGHNKAVLALRAESGEVVWKAAMRTRIESSPVICQDLVLVAGGDGRLHVFDLQTGNLRMELELGGRSITSPAVASQRVVVANDQGTIFCLGNEAAKTP